MEVGAPLGHWPLGRLCGGDLGPAHPQEVLTATPAPELLTVGISSALHPHESHLLDALRALFQASSGPELGCVVVLVSLSDSDPEWLSQTVANISDLFQAHIEARQLLVVRAQLGGPPPLHTLRPEDLPSSCEALYSVQKADHALLMNFAANLSANTVNSYILITLKNHIVGKCTGNNKIRINYAGIKHQTQNALSKHSKVMRIKIKVLITVIFCSVNIACRNLLFKIN